MRTVFFGGLLLMGLPLLSSCVALLDFDELQAGSGGGGGLSSGGSAGAPGSSGQGGSDDCGDCDDGDPCTTDVCTDVDGEPTCTYEVVTGLALDGVDESIWAANHHRVTLIGGPDAFFYSVYSDADGAGTLDLHRLGADEGTSEFLTSLDSFGLVGAREPVSAAGLALDDGVILGLHAFVGVRNAADDQVRTWHVALNGSYEVALKTAVGTSYYSAQPTNYPVAANLGGDIFAAWITGSQTIEVFTTGADNAVFSADTQATTLALLGTAEARPAVLYTGTGAGVFLETASGVTPVTECEPRVGSYLSAAATPIGIPGFHFASWTKAGEGFLRNESQVVGCTAEGCFADANCDENAGPVRNSSAVTAHLPGDPAGVVYYVLASPYLAPTGDTSVDAALTIGLVRIDFGPTPFAPGAPEPTFSPVGEAVEVSRMPTTEEQLFAGPDYPAVGYVAPGKVAVSWIEPDPAGGELLRVQRYQMCVSD